MNVLFHSHNAQLAPKTLSGLVVVPAMDPSHSGCGAANQQCVVIHTQPSCGLFSGLHVMENNSVNRPGLACGVAVQAACRGGAWGKLRSPIAHLSYFLFLISYFLFLISYF